MPEIDIKTISAIIAMFVIKLIQERRVSVTGHKYNERNKHYSFHALHDVSNEREVRSYQFSFESSSLALQVNIKGLKNNILQ